MCRFIKNLTRVFICDEAFGGDSERVTIFGDSAGGVSANLHVISKMSEGLFSQAIMQVGYDLIIPRLSKHVARLINHNQEASIDCKSRANSNHRAR